MITVKCEFNFDTPVTPGIYLFERIGDNSSTSNVIRELDPGEDEVEALYQFNNPNGWIGEVLGTTVTRIV